MDQLRLVGVHGDGEHLIVETPDSRRYLLRIDQQVRQAVQHARKKSPSRGAGSVRFGPRDIQARFRAGASVDDIVAESGWEPERVKRYEWPILAERAHMVREACKVKVSGTSPSHDGYRSVFEGEPRSLDEVVRRRAADSGIAADSLDWDAWQREDQLWTLQLTFSVDRDDQTPVDLSGPAEWVYNPSNQTVRPVNEWARTLCEEPRESGPLGTPAPAPGRVLSEDAEPEQEHRDTREAEQLLDVLRARRGRRLGADVEEDDRLAEILGRGMGRVETRPRPIDAPEDSELFTQPIQPAVAQASEERALAGNEDIEIVDATDASDHGEFPESAESRQPVETHDEHARPVTFSPVQSDTHGDHATAAASSQSAEEAGDAAEPEAESSRDTAESASRDEQLDDSPAAQSPGPRGRTGKAKRSSVPSWHDIVFGSNPS